jgi:hypothetical protein
MLPRPSVPKKSPMRFPNAAPQAERPEEVADEVPERRPPGRSRAEEEAEDDGDDVGRPQLGDARNERDALQRDQDRGVDRGGEGDQDDHLGVAPHRDDFTHPTASS